MAQILQNELATPNVNVYSGKSGKLLLEIERMLHHDGKPYIFETLQVDLLEENLDDSLAGYFGVEKTLELFSRKYYWLKMRVVVEKYV